MKLNTDNLKVEKKKLKRHHFEQNRLESVINYIRMCRDYECLKANPILKLFDFEELKNDMSGYISFNLCKNGGTIRLICSVNKKASEMKIEFISMKHYEDFKRKARK